MAEIDWSSTKESLKGVAITGLVVNVAYNMGARDGEEDPSPIQ